MSNRLHTFKTNEGDFNGLTKQWICDLEGGTATKIPGAMSKRGISDIIGAYEGFALYLENKFFHMRDNIQDNTVIIGEAPRLRDASSRSRLVCCSPAYAARTM